MEHLRNVIYPLLLEVLSADGQVIDGIYERNDSPSRLQVPQYKAGGQALLTRMACLQTALLLCLQLMFSQQKRTQVQS